MRSLIYFIFFALYFAFIWFNIHYRIGCFSVLSAILILVSFLCQIYEFLRQDAWKESIADQVICNLRAQVQVFIFIYLFIFFYSIHLPIFIYLFAFTVLESIGIQTTEMNEYNTRPNSYQTIDLIHLETSPALNLTIFMLILIKLIIRFYTILT